MTRSRHYATYGELFTKCLEERFERGASAYMMVELAKVYEGTHAELREHEFRDWLTTTGAFSCARCGAAFVPGKDVAEDHQIVCYWCR